MALRKRIHSVSQAAGGGGGPTTTLEAFSDTWSIAIKTTDSVATPAEQEAFTIALAQSDTVAIPDEAILLGISGAGVNDTTDTPVDARGATIRIWLSGSAGTDVSGPANADSEPDGSLATVSTGVLASNPEVMTSNMGVNVPSGITVTTATYTGWFRAQTTLVTSTASVVATSTGGLFGDITMFSQSSLGGDTNYLTTPFTFNLIAAGVDTLTKLQSLQIVHSTSDLAAGVTPAVLTVDAGSVDIVTTSI